jgi:hypothetical protein
MHTTFFVGRCEGKEPFEGLDEDETVMIKELLRIRFYEW